MTNGCQESNRHCAERGRIDHDTRDTPSARHEVACGTWCPLWAAMKVASLTGYRLVAPRLVQP